MMRKRLLFFIESFSGGGAERVLLTILRNLNMDRFDVMVLVMSDSGVYSKDFHNLDINIVPVLRSRSEFLNNIKYKLIYRLLPPRITFGWLFRKLEADTYIAFTEGYCTKILSRLHRNKRKIAWIHIDLHNFPWTIEQGIYRNIQDETRAYERFDTVIGVSDEVTEVMKTRYGLNKVCTIYNPIDEQRILRLSRMSTGISADKSCFNIVSVGRLTRQKGYDILIGLMPRILQSNPSVRLYIIGEGEERSALESQIKALNLTDSIILTGFMENPYALMKDMDLFVCSSVAEGFSLVIAEAMIVGLPVVSMACAGPSELLGQGEYGLLCPDYDALATSVVNISLDEQQLRELQEKSRLRALDFNTEKILGMIESIL